jgi:erythromycin esterase-like protein
MQRRLLLAATLLLSACGSDPTPVQPEEIVIPEGVHVLDGIAESLPYTDLAPVADIVGDATVVALGESTHTSAGYYRAKARLIRYLIEQKGFRVLVWESSWLESQVASSYVSSCAGTPEAAVQSLTTVWRDPTVRDLLQWLCQYNQAHAHDPVVFYGMDIQEPWRSAPFVDAFLKEVAPAEASRAQPLFSCIGVSAPNLTGFYQSAEFQQHNAGQRNVAAHDRCLAGITDVSAWITSNEQALASASSARRVEEAKLAVLGLHAWEQQLWLPDPAWYEVRDRAMANMTLRLRALEAPQKKTIVWAWNWHIAWAYQDVRGFDEDANTTLNRQGGRSMGGFLRDSLGASYRPIALIGYQVSTYGGGSDPIPTHDMSIERRLHALEEDYLIVDLRQPLPGALIPMGSTLQVSREWGDPYKQFSALLFLDHSPPMTFLGQ